MLRSVGSYGCHVRPSGDDDHVSVVAPTARAHRHTDPHRHAHRHTDTQTHRHTDTRTHRHTLT
jgi:hypothetical protein